MKEKKLLIVERSNATLNFQVEDVVNENNEHSDSIVLTGLFTSFDTKNRNGRIYESADFLPHVDALREQMNSHRLLGELDHPHGFEISLGNVSHVVESLEFDPQRNAIVGKIRLLNTSKGKEAQALVRDGIPLNISSRAAGTVDESGHVRLQQLFTYDLVADPGFANAQLKRVNESYGFGDDDSIDIYDISEDANTELDPKVVKTADYAVPQAKSNEDTLNNNNMEDNNKAEYIQYSDFQKYSEHLSDVVSELQSAVANLQAAASSKGESSETFPSDHIDNSMIADMIAKEVAKIQDTLKGTPVKADDACPDGKCEDEVDANEELAAMKEQYNNLLSYVKYLAETLDKSIVHQDYITEEANKMIKHQDYLAENMNKMIDHQDYLAENMNKMIDHQDYLAENINDTIAYQNYVAEMVDKHIDYTNMLAEEQNKTVAYTNYLAENQNKMIDHQDYIVEECNKMAEGLVEENKSKETVETPVQTVEEAETAETVETPARDLKKYQSELNEKLAALLNTVKTQYAEARQKELASLEESKKEIDTVNFNLINCMPSYLMERWTKLSDDRKKEILAESKMFVINNQASAEYFWKTRDMRDKQIEMQKIDESATAAPAAPVNENAVSDEKLQAYSARIKRNLGRF